MNLLIFDPFVFCEDWPEVEKESNGIKTLVEWGVFAVNIGSQSDYLLYII